MKTLIKMLNEGANDSLEAILKRKGRSISDLPSGFSMAYNQMNRKATVILDNISADNKTITFLSSDTSALREIQFAFDMSRIPYKNIYKVYGGEFAVELK